MYRNPDEHDSRIDRLLSLLLTINDLYLKTGDENYRILFHKLRDFLPEGYKEKIPAPFQVNVSLDTLKEYLKSGTRVIFYVEKKEEKTEDEGWKQSNFLTKAWPIVIGFGMGAMLSALILNLLL